MKVGDVVEITFLDHGEKEDVDLDVVSKNIPLLSTVYGKVRKLDKCKGHGFVEIVMWGVKEQNSKVAIVLLDTVLSEKVLK